MEDKSETKKQEIERLDKANFALKSKMFDMQCVIEKMAEYIDDIESDGDVCNTKRCSLDGYNYERDRETCINCIIKYFESEDE